MNIWYFKASSEEYQTRTEQLCYIPHCIPVLDQTYTSDELTRVLKHGRRTLSGIIITSQRSVTTLVQSNQQLSDSQRLSWQGIPLYIVGDTTTQRLKKDLENGLFFLQNEPRPPIFTTDHASALGDHLVQLDATHLLFLAGDKRREELPTRLRQKGYQLTEVQTYHTCQHPELARQLDRVSLAAHDWSVFFSPSGVDYFLSVRSRIETKVAAIGKTTAAHLQSLGYTVHAIAAKPDISHLLAAMVEYDQSNRIKSSSNIQ